jgi:ribose 5-phosphate isomerase A
METAEIKERCARAAVDELVKSGMRLGLGTGSTALPAVRRVGQLFTEGAIRDISAFPTSLQTAMECEKWGIPIITLNSRGIDGCLDLTIDGADQVDRQGRCTKGGGGALLIEKIAAYASAAFCIVADCSKAVDSLGLSFPVPLEVIPEARASVVRALEGQGLQAQMREAVRKAGPVITEHGNLLIDVRFPAPVDPCFWETEFNRIPGVVENGFFTRQKPIVYIGRTDGAVDVL